MEFQARRVNGAGWTLTFNSAYAREIGCETGGERGLFGEFFDRLVEFDQTHRIYNSIWERKAGPAMTAAIRPSTALMPTKIFIPRAAQDEIKLLVG